MTQRKQKFSGLLMTIERLIKLKETNLCFQFASIYLKDKVTIDPEMTIFITNTHHQNLPQP